VAALPPSLDATDVGPLLDRLTEATDDRPLLVVHLAAQQAQAACVVHLLRSPLELRAVATINSELSPLGAATVAALCAEPTHTFQIPAGSVAAGRSPPAPPMCTVGLGYTPTRRPAGVVSAVRLGSVTRLIDTSLRGS